MRQALVIALVVLVASPTLSGDVTNRDILLAMQQGSQIELRLADNTRLRGRLGAVSDSGFEFQTLNQNRLETRNISFDQLKYAKHIRKRSLFLLTLGVVTATILGVFVIVCNTGHCRDG